MFFCNKSINAEFILAHITKECVQEHPNNCLDFNILEDAELLILAKSNLKRLHVPLVVPQVENHWFRRLSFAS